MSDESPSAAALPSEAIHEILAWLNQVRPERLLLTCPADSPLKTAIDEVDAAPDMLHMTPTPEPDALLGDRRFDLAIVADTLERLPDEAAAQLIGRLRDLHTQRFLALVPMGGVWTNTTMIAYGLKRCARFDADDTTYGLYRFNIYDYKETPDWLNARYWAHPERWGKARW